MSEDEEAWLRATIKNTQAERINHPSPFGTLDIDAKRWNNAPNPNNPKYIIIGNTDDAYILNDQQNNIQFRTITLFDDNGNSYHSYQYNDRYSNWTIDPLDNVCVYHNGNIIIRINDFTSLAAILDQIHSYNNNLNYDVAFTINPNNFSRYPNWEQKYLKYKNKYITLKKQLGYDYVSL